jgi:hypothetical protein
MLDVVSKRTIVNSSNEQLTLALRIMQDKNASKADTCLDALPRKIAQSASVKQRMLSRLLANTTIACTVWRHTAYLLHHTPKMCFE